MRKKLEKKEIMEFISCTKKVSVEVKKKKK